ncbi:single-stranded DNA-binding protein [Lacihabitans sp. LS3-19]|uniref:single-stranded DNA-binding protein n=1 Tax=Lacihabitans sp. LS3-19 TaxID=2487335 RepID=UPI0020CF65CF|nr:single-stranded DNA-binding protein [Lacihabitans sp. LS3-19]MCP9767553.1 single-stranded DNA-binding protein [Lacihabitans sp. LS3-19]
MNSVKLIGNVGAEVNILKFDAGKKASFSLATTESFTNKDNQQVKNTLWHNVVAWGKTAELCEGLIKKGKLISIEGKLNYRNYTNSQNQKVYVTEIQAFKVEEYSFDKK